MQAVLGRVLYLFAFADSLSALEIQTEPRWTCWHMQRTSVVEEVKHFHFGDYGQCGHPKTSETLIQFLGVQRRMQGVGGTEG